MRRTLVLVLALCVGGMLVLGAVGAVAVLRTTETVESLSDGLSPAQVSNDEFMEAMLDAETELRAWQISGERTELRDYRAALRRAPVAARALVAFARNRPELADDVSTQQERAEAWIDDYAEPARAAGSGPAPDRAAFELGVRRFDALKAINQEIADDLAVEVASASDDAQRRLDVTLGLIVVIGLTGALACGLATWWLVRGIRRPLLDLERVVERLAQGDLGTRASLTGPAETRRLAEAVNDMAEEVSRSRALEQQVQQRLLEVDRVKSEFVSNVSHELRTPLTSIAGYLELLTDDLGDDLRPEHREMMAVMQRNVTRLRALIEDLLDLGRVELLPELLQPVDVARVLGDVAEDLRLSAGSRQVTIRVEASARPALVRGDAAQLHRAVANLVSNAVKFSQVGGAVVLRLTDLGDQLEVSVTDSGIGIPASDQDKLGERFFRASNAVSAHIPGTGLGLRMVQTIVSNHQGSFTLSSAEGQGTTATLRLPRRPAEAGALDLRRRADGVPVGEAVGEAGQAAASAPGSGTEQSVPTQG